MRRNTKLFPQQARDLLYKSYVRPILEYGCTVWDPPTNADCDKLERVQNMAARYVIGSYERNLSITATKETLKWELLEKRRQILRLKLFHNIYHGHIGIDRNQYILQPHYVSRRTDHELKVREYSCRTNLFKSTFFPKTISEWNRLPADKVSIIDNEAFAAAL